MKIEMFCHRSKFLDAGYQALDITVLRCAVYAPIPEVAALEHSRKGVHGHGPVLGPALADTSVGLLARSARIWLDLVNSPSSSSCALVSRARY